jgi:hypothetical protein
MRSGGLFPGDFAVTFNSNFTIRQYLLANHSEAKQVGNLPGFFGPGSHPIQWIHKSVVTGRKNEHIICHESLL